MSEFYSECGDDFDAYVRQTIGPMLHGDRRSVTNLWSGRRFKLHLDGEWRHGKVVEWNQWRVHPERHLTEWSVTIDLADTSMVSDSAANGCESTQTCEDNENTGPHLKLRVNRINIKGGGTLRREAKCSKLMSLKWKDFALPAANLDQGMFHYRCPFCRSSEPIMLANEKPVTLSVGECPICLENVECRVLQCGHGVCQCCWKRCRLVALTIDAQLEHLIPEEIEKERAKRGQHSSGEAVKTIQFHKLFEQVSSGEMSLSVFWKELHMVSAKAVGAAITAGIPQLSADAIKIILRVLEEREVEFTPPMNGEERTKEFISFYCCSVLSNKCLQDFNSRSAVAWSELALFHAKYTRSRQLYAGALVNLASDQQSAGMLEEASRTMEGILGLGISATEMAEHRDKLLREVDQWTGSSGDLTPWC